MTKTRQQGRKKNKKQERERESESEKERSERNKEKKRETLVAKYGFAVAVRRFEEDLSNSPLLLVWGPVPIRVHVAAPGNGKFVLFAHCLVSSGFACARALSGLYPSLYNVWVMIV